MKTSRLNQLNKKVDKLLSLKKVAILPIYGGASSGEPYRNVTPEEAEILQAKGMPAPITVCLNREQEFQQLLNNEYNN